MKKDRLSIFILAVELAVIFLLHSSRLNSSKNDELAKKEKVEKTMPDGSKLLLFQVK